MSGTAPSVLVVGPEPPSETFVRQLLDGLAARGTRVEVTASRHLAGSVPAACRPAPFVSPVYGYARQARNATAVAAADPGAIAAALRALPSATRARTALNRHALATRSAGRVVYFPWVSAAVTFGPLLPPGTPTVVSCRGSQVLLSSELARGDRYGAALGVALRSATLVHCVSGQLAGFVTERFGVDAARIRVIRPAVDTSRFRAVEHTTADPVIAGIGRLTWVKGWPWALEALAIVRREVPNARLVVLGEGEDRQQLEFTIRDLGLDGAVELRGQVGHEEVASVLGNASLLVSTSLSEGISNAVLEAMARGLPVVSTDVGGMAEVVEDGVNGFLVPPRSPAITAERVARLMRDPVLRGTMGSEARRGVLARHDLLGQIEAFESLFTEAFEGAR
jgi:colanic acid/amylovoran biosynthesis glycosyltransferase